MLGSLIRYFSYIFHGLLALFLLAVSGLALGGNPESLRLDMLPATGATLTYLVFFSALFGLLTVVLALLRKLPVLFLIWTIVVTVMMIKGYIFSSYAFGSGELGRVVLLILASIIAIAGPWLQMRAPAALDKRAMARHA